MEAALSTSIAKAESQPRSNLPVTAAAERLGVSAAFLNKLRSQGGGPIFAKLGRRVVYSIADLDAWQHAHRRRSTSDDQG